MKVKPFMLTRQKVSRAVRNALRETARKHLESRLKARNAQEIFSEIMSNRLQKELSLKLKKIYPLAFCVIRVLEIVKEKTPDQIKEVNEDKYFRKERSFGSFYRAFTLPSTINPENIKATFKDGVLEIEIPKPEEKKLKNVQIKIE